MTGSSNDPILLLDDDLPTNILDVTGVSFDDIRLDWEEFESVYDAMLNDTGFDEIGEEESAEILAWCNEVEEEEWRRILGDYTDTLDGVNLDEFFYQQEEQHRRSTYVDTLDDVDMEEVFGEWWKMKGL